ncbi:MAG TPA: MBL fold metallo-hydrolase [Terriglobales bacterium]|nr:MBL fold metallo-hydrolase [Terriglobales bacterium]
MKYVLPRIRAFTSIHALVLALTVTGATSSMAGQAGTDETVIQRATEQFENTSLKTISLGKGLFVFSGDGGNITAIVDDGSTLLIDSGLDSRAAEVSDAIFKATMRPVTRLVNTHWHFDHTGGNVFFGSAGVTIIAQENVKKRLSSVQDVPFIGLRDGHYPPQALPTLTYSSSMTLTQGSQQLTLANYGSAHTDGDTVTYISPANVVVVGDIFSNHFYPIIDLASGGSIDGMIQSLDRVLAQTDAQTKIVPGHGPVATRADLQEYRDMLAQVRQRIKVLITSGKTIDEAVAAAPTKDFDAKWGGGYVPADVFTKMVFSSLTNAGSASR